MPANTVRQTFGQTFARPHTGVHVQVCSFRAFDKEPLIRQRPFQDGNNQALGAGDRWRGWERGEGRWRAANQR